MDNMLEMIAALRSTDSGPEARTFWGVVGSFTSEGWLSRGISAVSIERGENAVRLTITLMGDRGAKGAEILYHLNASADGIIRKRHNTGDERLNHRGPVENQALGAFILKALMQRVDNA